MIFQTVGSVILHDWHSHWRSLLHQDCQISESPFGTQRDISQMCLQLAGCSQHHPLTWNVSWAGDNLLGFLLSHHKNPSEGQLCYGCPAHIWEADSEPQITQKGEESHFWGILFTFHFSSDVTHVGMFDLWAAAACEAGWLVLQHSCPSNQAGWPCNERVRWDDELARCTGEDSSAAGCMDETHARVTVRPAAALKVVTDIMSWYSISIHLTNWMRKNYKNLVLPLEFYSKVSQLWDRHGTLKLSTEIQNDFRFLRLL